MITTHILDLAAGTPAAGVKVRLARLDASGNRTAVGEGSTDADGRLRTLVAPETRLPAGDYELSFETGAYFEARGTRAFHPRVTVTFRVAGAEQHYHVPLLISPYGFTTYRGS